MIQQIRLALYTPSLTFHQSNLSTSEINVLNTVDGSFHCRYRIPNSLIPRLQARILLTTQELIIMLSENDDGIVVPLSDLTTVTIEQGYLRAYTGEFLFEFQVDDSDDGKSFAKIVKESWEDISGAKGESIDLDEQYEKQIDRQIEKMKQRETQSE